MFTSSILCLANALFLFALMDDDLRRRAITHPTFKQTKLAKNFNGLLNFFRIAIPLATSCSSMWILQTFLLTAQPFSHFIFYIGGLLMHRCSIQATSLLLEYWFTQQVLRSLNNKYSHPKFAFNAERNIFKLLNGGGTALLLQKTGHILGLSISDDGKLITQTLTVDFTHQDIVHA